MALVGPWKPLPDKDAALVLRSCSPEVSIQQIHTGTPIPVETLKRFHTNWQKATVGSPLSTSTTNQEPGPSPESPLAQGPPPSKHQSLNAQQSTGL